MEETDIACRMGEMLNLFVSQIAQLHPVTPAHVTSDRVHRSNSYAKLGDALDSRPLVIGEEQRIQIPAPTRHTKAEVGPQPLVCQCRTLQCSVSVTGRFSPCPSLNCSCQCWTLQCSVTGRFSPCPSLNCGCQCWTLQCSVTGRFSPCPSLNCGCQCWTL